MKIKGYIQFTGKLRGAHDSKGFDTPRRLETDKEYFRIAKESTFLCKTRWFPESRVRTGKIYKAHSQFHCTMQIVI